MYKAKNKNGSKGISLFPENCQTDITCTHSSSDILIYELRMHWLPTAKIDLLVHLIQPVSELESNYDSEADRQTITFLFSLSLPLSPFFFSPLFFILCLFCIFSVYTTVIFIFTLLCCVGSLNYSFGRFGCSHIEQVL